MESKKGLSLATLISRRMGELRLSNAALGRAIGVSGQAVSDYRHGSVPSEERLERIADALRLPLEEVKAAAGLGSTANGAAADARTPLGVAAERIRAREAAERLASAVQEAQARAEAAGLARPGQTYEMPYAMVNDAKIPLPIHDATVDPATGRPLIGFITLPVALGPPRVHDFAIPSQALSSGHSPA